MSEVSNAPQHPGSQSSVTSAMPRAAQQSAIQAIRQLPPFDPVPSVGYRSQGRLLLIADTELLVERAVEALDGKLSLALLWASEMTPPKEWPVVELARGQFVALHGFLGAFSLDWRAPDGGLKGAAFDLVLDMRSAPAFAMHQPPQGYFHAVDEPTLAIALRELPEMVGEFEKPKFFNYKESLCAHSRSKKQGCNKCIEVCSTEAIRSAGDKVEVDPYLCMGCGACASVCPSGAMGYQFPRVADRGTQLRAGLSAFRQSARGSATDAPLILFYPSEIAIDESLLPPRVVPLDVWHSAAIGLEVLLGAVVYGAAGVVVLARSSDAPQYRSATLDAFHTAESLLSAFGFSGHHFTIATDVAAISWEAFPRRAAVAPADFHLSNDKRGTLEFIVEHLAKQAAQRVEMIPLAAGSMWGGLKLDTQKCTMCLACAGACPESALMDGGDQAESLAQLNFLERNCVQCGLCVNTCPEDALSLVPRLLLTDQRRQKVVLNEAKPFDCIRCGKALGTQQMIQNMLGKLSGHSMFSAPGALDRLKMCADCRVVDMMSNPNEVSVLTGKPMQ